MAKFGKRVKAFHLNVDDFIQEVCLTLWRRQTMKSRWDPDKKGWCGYVLLVARTVLDHQTRANRYGIPRPLFTGLEQVPAIQAPQTQGVMFLNEQTQYDLYLERLEAECEKRGKK